MKWIARGVGIIVLVLSLTLAPLTLTGCDSINSLLSAVNISEIESEILILADGTVQITEIYHVNAPRESWGLNLVRPHPRRGNTELVSIGIAASGLNPIPIYTQFTEEAKDKLKNAPAAYAKKLEDDLVAIQMHTHFGRGDWLIKVQWSLLDAVVQNGEDALLDLPLLSLKPKANSQLFSATLILPQRISTAGANVVTQTAANLVLSQQESNIIKIRTNDFGHDDYLRLLISTAANVFTALEQDPIDLSLDQQFQEAALAAQNLTDIRHRREFARKIIPYLTLAGLFLALSFYIYYEREGFKTARRTNYALWVSSVKPYNASMLLKRNSPGRVLLSSLLALVNQKELWLDDYVFTWPHSGRVDFSALRPSETYLLHWLFQDLATGGPALSAAQLKRAALSPASAEGFKQNFREFEELIYGEYLTLGLYDQTKTKFGRILTASFFVISIVLVPLLSYLSNSFHGLLLLLPAISFLLLRLGVRHLTREGRTRSRECHEYSKNLDNLPLLTAATGSHYSLTETAILALPRAVALDRINLFFDGLYELSDEDFASCAHAILHVYLRTPLPRSIRITAQERAELWQQLDDLRDILLSSETIINAGFQ
ncbi:MAG: hypothetical protein ACOX3P_06215 [Saccharofermentanales bacterium]|nr:DUF2207 domain-containing protein [Bacillota bacterium]